MNTNNTPPTRNSKLETIYLSTAYLPPIQYISKFLISDDVQIDLEETFLKQSYRNRCTILGANGTQDLTIPVIKPDGNKTKSRDVQIEYRTNWQQVHWRAIVSAYNQSPFFEILEAEFAPLFEKKPTYLFDWNAMALELVGNSIEHRFKFNYTNSFIKPSEAKNDFRNCISPKPRLQKPGETFNAFKYHQVFEERHGFVPNLSIIDLLFNEGPQTISICRNSINLSSNPGY